MNFERGISARVVQNQQRNGTIFVLKGSGLKAITAEIRRRDASCSWMHEAAGMTDRVIILCVDRAMRSHTAIDGYKAAARVAASRIGPVFFIKCYTPERNSLCPVAC